MLTAGQGLGGNAGDLMVFPSLAFEGVDKIQKYPFQPTVLFQIESQICRKNM